MTSLTRRRYHCINRLLYSPKVPLTPFRLRRLLYATTSMPANFSDAEQKAQDPTAHEQRFDGEKHVQRNPHPDFGKVQASRPAWEEHPEWQFTKTRNPDWKLGDGANDGGESLRKDHVEIDPYEEGRPAVFNYKLLISGIIPRPIGFIGTQSKDGTLEAVLSFRRRSSVRLGELRRLMASRDIFQPSPHVLHSGSQS